MRLDKQQTTNACWMRRSTVTDDDDDDDSHRSSSTSPATGLNEKSGHGKRSLEDYGFLSSSSSQVKRRRHLSPQNSNIESTPTMLKKKSQTKKKSNSSMEENGRTKSKCSSRQSNGGASDQMNELTLPNWERICPHLDQILSNKHCQSGVYAHEVQLVQQELEALLSMSIVRENILKDFQHSSTSNAEDVRSKILKHQEAERFYSSKKLSKKPTTGTPVNSTPFLDRQVAVAPQQGARIDRIWSDVDNYLSRISSSDLRDLENLVEFHENLHEILSSSSLNDPSELSEALRPFNCPTVEHFLQAPTVLSHYLDRTTLGSFQKKLYEQIGQTSPVYRTPISSPMHHSRTMDSSSSSSLRISPRLHPQEFHADESSKMKRKGKSVLLSPSSTMKFHERFQLVQHYLTDEHLQPSTVKRQLFPSSTKKRQHSPSESSSISENFQRKLSTLIGLVKECQSISSNALARARRQRDYEQIREKCRTIESDLQSYVEKFDLPTTHASNEKSLQTLRQTLIEWEKLEDQLRQVLQPI